MSHPIRPESYIAMDNFYTATVYSKGSEVIRMYNTLLTPAGFRKGMDLYFDRHDGQAVTCDDFRAAMADANGVDLGQFERWYLQKGTPTVTYASEFDADKSVFKVTLKQSTPAAPENLPFHIPVSFGVIDSESGEELLSTRVLELKSEEEAFEFELSGVVGTPVPSLLRGFSAPVKLARESEESARLELLTLAAYDTDGFNRWEAGQKLYADAIFEQLGGEAEMEGVYEAFGQTLTSSKISDDSIRAYGLMLPTEGGLAEDMDVIDPVGLREARAAVKRKLARKFKAGFTELYQTLTDEMKGKPFEVNSKAIGKVSDGAAANPATVSDAIIVSLVAAPASQRLPGLHLLQQGGRRGGGGERQVSTRALLRRQLHVRQGRRHGNPRQRALVRGG